jgi:hypothetical protein
MVGMYLKLSHNVYHILHKLLFEIILLTAFRLAGRIVVVMRKNRCCKLIYEVLSLNKMYWYCILLHTARRKVLFLYHHYSWQARIIWGICGACNCAANHHSKNTTFSYLCYCTRHVELECYRSCDSNPGFLTNHLGGVCISCSNRTYVIYVYQGK